MPLTPNADGTLFFIGQLQARNVVIALQLVPKPNLLVVNVLFHDVILQIRLIPAIQSFWLITKAQREATSLRSASLGDAFPLWWRRGESILACGLGQGAGKRSPGSFSYTRPVRLSSIAPTTKKKHPVRAPSVRKVPRTNVCASSPPHPTSLCSATFPSRGRLEERDN